jgi:subtilisin-like proprotein convertase family protein
MLVGALALAAGSVAVADVYNGTGGAIPDRGATGVGPPTSVFTSTVNVPGGSVISVNNVTLNFGVGPGATGAHSWVGDLVVKLTAPNGDNVHLFSRLGATTATGFGRADDMSGGPYVFVNSGGANMLTTLGNPVPAGTYDRSTNNPIAPPPQDLDDYTVFNGDNAAGAWTLTIEDWAGGDTGGLANWSLDITVPEPGSMGLLAGAAALPLLRRRRR